MFRYLFEIFCKDTIIGLCPLEKNKTTRIFKNKYSNALFKSNYVKSSFYNSFAIDQTVYHL